MVDFTLYQSTTLVLRVLQILVTGTLAVMTVLIAKKSYIQQKTPEIEIKNIRKAKDHCLKFEVYCNQGKARIIGFKCSIYRKIEDDGNLQLKTYDGFMLMPNVSEEVPVVLDHGDAEEFELSSLPHKAENIEEIQLDLNIKGHRERILHLHDF